MRHEGTVIAGTTAARSRTRLIVGLAVCAGVLLLAIANAHLIYVATTSQPACVPHVQQGQGIPARGLYSAAESACSPSQRNGETKQP